MRTATINRETKETNIALSLTLEGTGNANINTGVGFLDHMLDLFARHGRFDLAVTCNGDVRVDDHHSVEDVGICLGRAFREALGDCKGILRYGSMLLPMDEALVQCAVDVSGRSYLVYRMEIPTEKVGTFDTELVEEFLIAFTREAGITLHARQLDGTNSHHIIEALFKALGRALSAAVRIDPDRKDEIPSTKGTLI